MTAPSRQRRVLFLIADTGAGHRSAANAIHHAMRLLAESPSLSSPRIPVPGGGMAPRPGRVYANDGWEATIVDAFAECSQCPLRNSVFLYAPAIKYSPRLYGQVYRITNSRSRFRAASRLTKPFLYHGLTRLFLETRPDVIISVHPLLNHITLQVLRDLDVRVPFITVVTDLVSVHCAWIAPGVTACVVPTEDARRLALDAGVPSKRVHLLGMPIDPRFAQPSWADQETLRAALGLDPELPVVLMVGGGEGAIGLADAVAAVGHSDLRVQLLVVTGHNKALLSQLQRQSTGFRVPARILGFVHNMPDLMHAADVIVTKAGPGTITEAMACGLPIVLTGAIPGQEEGNVEFVLRQDVGVLARSPDAVVAALRGLLEPGSARLEEMRAHAREISRPEASLDIARLIMKHLPDKVSRSVWERVRPQRGLRRYRGRRVVRSPRMPSLRGRPLGLRVPRPLAARGRNGLRGARRIPSIGLGLRADGRLRRLPGITNFKGARALLLRGTQLGKVQLRRPGSGRGRDDAGTPLGSRGD